MNIDPPKTPAKSQPRRRINPEDLKPKKQPDQQASNNSYLVWGTFSVLCIVALMVIFALPDWVGQQSSALLQDDGNMSGTESLKARAQQRFDKVRQTVQKLQSMGVEDWPGAVVKPWLDGFDAAQKALGAQDFSQTISLLDKVEAPLELLLQQQSYYFDEGMSLGRESLARRQSDDARKQFRLALKIQPENPDAIAGLAQADVIGQVDGYMAEGQQLLADERLDEARQRFQEAVKLDPEFKPARQALAEIEQRLSRKNLTALMSDGFSDLREKRYQQALKKFTQAQKIEGTDPRVSSAIAQARDGLQQQQISEWRRQAESAERQEDWGKAIEYYQKALKIDSGLSFAKQGLVQSQSIEKIHRQLDTILSQSDRLSEPSARQNARQWLQQARQNTSSSPGLEAKGDLLEAKIRVAEQQLEVMFVSDGETEVTIYKVAYLGRFEHRVVELQVGRYSIKGSRPGYRDVNIILDLNGVNDQPVYTVRCEEPI